MLDQVIQQQFRTIRECVWEWWMGPQFTANFKGLKLQRLGSSVFLVTSAHFASRLVVESCWIMLNRMSQSSYWLYPPVSSREKNQSLEFTWKLWPWMQKPRSFISLTELSVSRSPDKIKRWSYPRYIPSNQFYQLCFDRQVSTSASCLIRWTKSSYCTSSSFPRLGQTPNDSTPSRTRPLGRKNEMTVL